MNPDLNKILYVEDDEDIAEIAIITLEEIGGFEVCHCFSGAAALQQLTQFEPQLILMDIMMPEMDGPTTLREMRKLAQWQEVPVVFMTARVQTHEQQAYLALGAAGVIAKPFDPATLCTTITQLWRNADAK